MHEQQKILVVGATGGSGRAAVKQLLDAGHSVTAFSRSADKLGDLSPRFTAINGDATNSADVDRVVRGHDAVVVTLGISENPLRVRLFGTARTPMDVRSAGTRNVIAAMQKHGVRRLVVQSSFGVGQTRDRLLLLERLFFSLLLKPQIEDTEAQELEVRRSDVDWVLVQPVHLTDDDADDMPFVSIDGQVQRRKVSRNSVGRFLSHAAYTSEHVRQNVALSGGGAA